MKPDLRIRVIPAIGDVPAARWDACANPGEGPSTVSVNLLSRPATSVGVEEAPRPDTPLASQAPRASQAALQAPLAPHAAPGLDLGSSNETPRSEQQASADGAFN